MFEATLYLIGSYSLIFAIGFVFAARRNSRSGLRAVLYAVAIPTAFVGVIGMIFMLSFVVLPMVPFLNYSFFAYLLFLVVFTVLILRYLIYGQTGRYRLPMKGLAFLSLMFLPLLPYAAVELQTHLAASESFTLAVRKSLVETGWWTEPIRIMDIKVLKIAPHSAVVYIVTGDQDENGEFNCVGDIVELVNSESGWRYKPDSWSTVWSDTGSAHGITFPPYPNRGDYKTKR